MRIIIGGAGRVGTELARALRAEEMDVVLVDSDSRAVKNAQNLDVLVIHGDLTTREKLDEAGIGEAEIFVAVFTGFLTFIFMLYIHSGVQTVCISLSTFLLVKCSFR